MSIHHGGRGPGHRARVVVFGGETIELTAPVLTRDSADGANPMTWTAVYTDVAVGDIIHLAWTVNGVAGAGDSHTLTSDDIILASEQEGAYQISFTVYLATVFEGGDVVAVTETIERDGVFSPASNTITDTIAITAVTYSHGDEATSASSSTVVSFSTLAFAGGGRALLSLTCFSNGGGGVDSVPASLTITPTAGGAGINCTKLGSGGKFVGRAIAFYLSDSDVTATNYDITGTRPAAARSNTVMYGTLIGANPTPTSGPTFSSASETNPHATTSLTCPSDGLIYGAFLSENSLTATAVAGTTLSDQNFFNSECGLIVGYRTTTGGVAYTAAPNSTFNHGRGVVAFAPA